jgi:hypothetical protein
MSSRKRPMSKRPSYFQRTSEGVPELSEQKDGQTSHQEKPKRTKRTYYLPDEVIISLGELQLRRHRETGTKPEASELVEEAIRKLVEHQNI